MDSFEDRGILQRRDKPRPEKGMKSINLANVTRGSQAQSTNETGAHIGKNVTIKVGHDHYTVRVRARVGNDLSRADSAYIREYQEGVAYLQADAVQQVLVILNIREVVGNISASGEEHAV